MVSPYLKNDLRDYVSAEAEIMKKRRELTLRLLKLPREGFSGKHEARRNPHTGSFDNGLIPDHKTE